MKTKEIPAIVMLSAGGVYCLLGLLYQIPLMDFTVQLLIVLLVFWIFGGIIRMFLDKFMGEIEDKAKEEDKEAEEKDVEGESDGSEENSDVEKKSSEEEE